MAYLPLSTANLPDPVIDPAKGSSPEDYFDIDIYSGTSATHERSNFTFQPDFLWLKRRDGTGDHIVHDILRGTDGINRLFPNLTREESTDGDGFLSIDDDGFTLTSSGGDVNTSGRTYVAWGWKAGGSGVSNTDGSITSTVSASTESGFSIVTYAGTGASATIGHGLDQTPEMIIVKARDVTPGPDWQVGVASDFSKQLHLNDTTAFSSNSNIFSTPNSTTFPLGSNSSVNGSGDNFVAYVFHSVDSYSKISSYVGNGSSDGVFVYTGFRPAFVMVKATDSTASWVIIDNERAGYNVENYRLFAESSNAESTTTPIVDLLSNGFKWRNNFGNFNGSGTNYIYMAFAENPFKYSNAR